MKENQEKKPLKILHLADVQIGLFSDFPNTKNLSKIRKKKEKMEKDEEYGEEEFEKYKGGNISIAKQNVRQDVLPPLTRKIDYIPDIIIVSGDIVSTGAKAEYEVAEMFLEELVEGLGNSGISTLIIPGNHDINRDGHKKLDNYYEFIRKIYSKEIFDPQNRIKVPYIEDESKKIDNPRNAIVTANFVKESDTFIVGIDTTQNTKEGYPWVFVSKEQKREIKSSIERECKKEPVNKIAVFHNNPLPTYVEEDEGKPESGNVKGIFLNAANILEELQSEGFDIVIHGHQHRNDITRYVSTSINLSNPHQSNRKVGRLSDSPLCMVGSGAFGADQDEMGRDVSRSYSSIKVYPARRNSQKICDVRINRWRADISAWTTSKTISPKKASPTSNSELNSQELGKGLELTSGALLELLLPAANTSEALEVLLQAFQATIDAEIVLVVKRSDSEASILDGDIEHSNISSHNQEFLTKSFERKTQCKHVYPGDTDMYTTILIRGNKSSEGTQMVSRRDLDCDCIKAYHFTIHRPKNKEFIRDIICLKPFSNEKIVNPTRLNGKLSKIGRTKLPWILKKCFESHENFLNNFLSYVGREYTRYYSQDHEQVVQYRQNDKNIDGISWNLACGLFVENEEDPFLCKSKEEATAEVGVDYDDFPELKHIGGSHQMESSMYKAYENPLFILKKRIEKLIILSLGHKYTKLNESQLEKGSFMNMEDFVEKKIKDGLIQKITKSPAGEIKEDIDLHEHLLNPLLVSFYLPVKQEDDDVSKVRFFPTRDQLTWLLSRTSQNEKEDVERLINHTLESYYGQVFSGLAPYVYETGEPYYSKNGFDEPVVNGQHLNNWLSTEDNESKDGKNAPISREIVSKLRDKRLEVNKIESKFWNVNRSSENLHVLDVPVIYRGKKLAVVQIQSEVGDAVEAAVRPLISIIQEISLPLILGPLKS